MNQSFQFKYFSVNQDKSSMKIGTDGTLLGAWCDVMDKYRVLDIGSGTGLIALMIAQRNNLALIDAVEIEENAYMETVENFNQSPWQERLHAHHVSLQHFKPLHAYDLIVSNPPFFNESSKNSDEKKTMARHTDSLSHKELLSFASTHLYENGILSLILPTEEAKLFEEEALKNNLFVSRKTRVFSNTESTTHKRVLMEFSKNIPDYIHENSITIETTQRHEYTEEYIDLTKDFFLKF